jgi:hypothetical protein
MENKIAVDDDWDDREDDWDDDLYQDFLRAVISDTERDIRESKSDSERAAHEAFLQDMRERLETSLALDGDANEE